MQIPKSFQIFGYTIKVEHVDRLLHESDSLGECRYRDSKILLQKPSKQNPIPKQRQEQVFLHELIHMIFNHLNEDELRKNEKLVDLIAQALYQYEVTKK